MSLSDSSELSSPPSTEDEAPRKNGPQPSGLDRYFKPAPKALPKVPSSPPPPKRPASPPREHIFADNPDIAFIVMFRSRFHTVFPKSLPQYGPQDIEAGVEDAAPGEHVEKLLCALLGLVLNRKKDVERGHFQRALEEALQTHRSHWPAAWGGKNPTHSGGTFTSMTPVERLALLKTLILWSLSSSEAVQTSLKESYKQVRHEDDRNQPLSVQPWGRDGYKRRYWLIEGQDDTYFRLYRENNGITSKTNQWFSVAGSIEEIKHVADNLDEEGTPHARTLRDRIRAAIPRFESGEEKRRRRDYRLARKAAFTRPEPGFSLYEGRTRGKRMRYTFSDDEDDSDRVDTSKSTRNPSASNPLEHVGPVVTTSGRQVKSRLGGIYGEAMLVEQRKGLENERSVTSASASAAANGGRNGKDGHAPNGGAERLARPQRVIRAPHRIDDSSEEKENQESDGVSSDNEWSGNEEELDGAEEFEADGEQEEEDDDDFGIIPNGTTPTLDKDTSKQEQEQEQEQDRLIVQLRYRQGGKLPTQSDRSKVEDDAKTLEAMMTENCIAIDSGLPPPLREAAHPRSSDVCLVDGEALRQREVKVKPSGANELCPTNDMAPSAPKVAHGPSHPIPYQQDVQS